MSSTASLIGAFAKSSQLTGAPLEGLSLQQRFTTMNLPAKSYVPWSGGPTLAGCCPARSRRLRPNGVSPLFNTEVPLHVMPALRGAGMAPPIGSSSAEGLARQPHLNRHRKPRCPRGVSPPRNPEPRRARTSGASCMRCGGGRRLGARRVVWFVGGQAGDVLRGKASMRQWVQRFRPGHGMAPCRT
jgi:hypothetical protein